MQGYPVRIHDSVAGTVSAAALNQRVFVHSPVSLLHSRSIIILSQSPCQPSGPGAVPGAILRIAEVICSALRPVPKIVCPSV